MCRVCIARVESPGISNGFPLPASFQIHPPSQARLGPRAWDSGRFVTASLNGALYSIHNMPRRKYILLFFLCRKIHQKKKKKNTSTSKVSWIELCATDQGRLFNLFVNKSSWVHAFICIRSNNFSLHSHAYNRWGAQVQAGFKWIKFTYSTFLLICTSLT